MSDVGIPADAVPIKPRALPAAVSGIPLDAVPIRPREISVPNSPIEPPQVHADRDARHLLDSGMKDHGKYPSSPELDAVLRGSTLGWLNELTADEHAALTGAENLYRKATGKTVPYGIGEAREAMLSELRKDQEKFHHEHPHLDTALEFTGALATPGMGKVADFVKGGANFATRAVRSAVAGYGVGSIAGASDERDREGSSESGGTWGAALGGGLHLLGSAVFRGLPAVAGLMKTPMVETWKGVQRLFGADKKGATPEEIAKAQRSAMEYVAKVAEAAKKTPADLAARTEGDTGKPLLAAESLGRQGITQLGAVGRRGGETPDNLESALRTRQHWAPARIRSDLAEITGVDPAAIEGDFKLQIKTERAKAAPLYDVAYQDKADTPKLRALLERPSVKKALIRAVEIAEEEGVDPMTVGLVLKGGPKIGAHADDSALQLVAVENPTMRTWDYIKRAQDDILEKERDPITKKLKLDEKTGAIKDTLDELRAELFKESPAYKNALAQGGEAPRQIDAYHEAPRLMSPTVTAQTFNERLAAMTPAQREALKGGLIADIYNRSSNNKIRLKDMQSPAYVEKLRAVLGFDEANKFLAKAESEMRMQASGNRMMPGNQSATMEFGAADAEREAATTALARAGLEFGKGNYLKSLAHIAGAGKATVQTLQLDEVARNEVGRLLMLTPEQLSAELGAHIKSRGANPAKSFVRQLASDPMVLDAARRLTAAMPGFIGQNR